MGHKRFFPKRIEWYKCLRCGEPKRPHRICTKNVDICALREDEWLAIKKSRDEANNNIDNNSE